MRIYYKPESGAILHTLTAEHYPDLPGNWIEVPDQPLGDLGDWRVEGGQLMRCGLGGAKAKAVTSINMAADTIRRRYVTQITGQDMLYMTKRDEAAAYLADPDPDLTNYPLLAAEVGITAPTAYHVAQVYLGLSAIWIALVAPLETARLGAIKQIEMAEDAETIEAAVTTACSMINHIANMATSGGPQ